MTDDVEEMRRKVAQEYHRVMMDIFAAGYSEMEIVKDGRRMVRRFSRDENKTITYQDVESSNGDS
jgi:hypothetical protein